MKAIYIKKSGKADLLKLVEMDKPIPKDSEILVKVHISTVTRGDVALRQIPRFILAPIGLFFGFKAMNIPGVEYAGTVEAVGTDVKTYKAGDEVFGTTTGLKFGGNAEYVCVPEKSKLGVLALKPKNMSFSEAAATPVGGMTAIWLLSKTKIKSGDKVLVYGASGSVGTNAVQVAKSFGAEVTGICSTNNIEMVKSIGAKSVIDYTKDDFSKNGIKYDIIFDAVGKISKSSCKGSLQSGGFFVSVKSPTKETKEDLNLLISLSEKGQIKPVIDKSYKLEETVDAHKYVEKGHKIGNIIIKVV